MKDLLNLQSLEIPEGDSTDIVVISSGSCNSSSCHH